MVDNIRKDDNENKYPKKLYNVPLSTSTNISNPNQLAELESKIKFGYPGVEIGTNTFERQWETIPKIVFEEIARQARINDINLSIHAPENDFQLDVIGYARKNQYSQEDIKNIGYKLSAFLETAADMARIYGKSIRVNMHEGDTPLTVWNKQKEEQIKSSILNNLNNNNNLERERLNNIVDYLFRLGSIDYNKYNQLKNYLNSGNYREFLDNLPSWVYADAETVVKVDSNGYELEGAIKPEYIFYQKSSIVSGINENKTIVEALENINQYNIEKSLEEVSSKLEDFYAMLGARNILNVSNRNIIGLVERVAIDTSRYFVTDYVNESNADYGISLFTRILDMSKQNIEYLAAVIKNIKENADLALKRIKERNNINSDNDINKLPPDARNIYEKYNNIINEADRIINNLRNIYSGIDRYENEIKNIYNQLKESMRRNQVDRNLIDRLHDMLLHFNREIVVNQDNNNQITLFDEINNSNIRREFYRFVNDLKEAEVPLIYPAQEVGEELAIKSFEFGLRMWLDKLKQEIKNNPENISLITDYLPEIVIEESYAGALGTRPDIWIKLINDLRNKAKDVLRSEIDNMIQELRNSNTQEAKEKIKKLEEFRNNINNIVEEKIGATLDVGHIKMFMANGYTTEDILKWVEQIKPYIKHMHVHETQWGGDTHLPLGFGWDDVVKKELEKLQDILGKEGIILVHEPGGWYSGFSKSYGIEYQYLLRGANIYGYSDIPESSIIPTSTYINPEAFQAMSPAAQYGYGYSIMPSTFFSQLDYDIRGGRQGPNFSGTPIS